MIYNLFSVCLIFFKTLFQTIFNNILKSIFLKKKCAFTIILYSVENCDQSGVEE